VCSEYGEFAIAQKLTKVIANLGMALQ